MNRGTTGEMLREAVERFGPDALRHTNTVGMTVAAANSDGLLFQSGLGILDADRHNPMPADATFPIGSVGKLLTTTAVMRAAESGAVTLDAPVENYLGYPVRHPNSPNDPVTLRRLLTHTSGLHIDAHSARMRGSIRRTGDYLRTLVERGFSHEYGGIPLWGDPGNRYQYSSIGFQLAAEAVGSALGRPIAEVIRRQICRPLEMDSTYVGPAREIPAPIRLTRATGHMQFADLLIPTPEFESRLPESTGVFSTAADLVRWGLMVLSGGTAPNGAAILSPESLMSMSEPLFGAAFPGEVPLHVGTGMQVYAGGCIGHIGSYPFGWSGQLRIYPKLDLVVAALTNSWDMCRYVLPSDRSAWGLLLDHLAGVAAGGLPARSADPDAIAELFGVLAAERCHLIGAPFDPTQAQSIAKRALRTPVDGRISPGEIAAFVRGVRSANDAGPTADGIAELLRGPDGPVHPDTARLLALGLGATRATWPSPHPEWTRQQEQP
jgi:CubicO group peptidase (beta-lactamase class C family)